MALGQSQGDQEQAHVPLARPVENVPWQVATHQEVVHALVAKAAAQGQGQEVSVEVG